MERYTDRTEWDYAIGAAERALEEVKRAIPLHYELFCKMLDAKNNKWVEARQDISKYSDRQQLETIKENCFNNYMKQWSELPKEAYKLLWDMVEEHNRQFKGAIYEGKKFKINAINTALNKFKGAKQ